MFAGLDSADRDGVHKASPASVILWDYYSVKCVSRDHSVARNISAMLTSGARTKVGGKYMDVSFRPTTDVPNA